MTTTFTSTMPTWQGHKHTESTDSETSFFDPSSSTSTTADEWSGYFEGWNVKAPDSYCPEIVSASSSPTKSNQSDKTPTYDFDSLLPSARPIRPRPRSTAQQTIEFRSPQLKRRTKRYGIVPYANDIAGINAAAQLDKHLQNPLANTEDILAAMYSTDWDATSLRRWYEDSPKTPADLALFKIMFSLRYTPDGITPPTSH